MQLYWEVVHDKNKTFIIWNWKGAWHINGRRSFSKQIDPKRICQHILKCKYGNFGYEKQTDGLFTA
jgi:hypothetical protein